MYDSVLEFGFIFSYFQQSDWGTLLQKYCMPFLSELIDLGNYKKQLEKN